jgi:hypothetical protein
MFKPIGAGGLPSLCEGEAASGRGNIAVVNSP